MPTQTGPLLGLRRPGGKCAGHWQADHVAKRGSRPDHSRRRKHKPVDRIVAPGRVQRYEIGDDREDRTYEPSAARARIAAAPVNGWQETTATGRDRAIAAPTGPTASPSIVERSRRIPARELLRWNSAPHNHGAHRINGP